jgi:CubicO group peptidase (beta-lactamase class C family)
MAQRAPKLLIMLVLWGLCSAAPNGCAPRPAPTVAQPLKGAAAIRPGSPGVALAVVDRQSTRLVEAHGTAVFSADGKSQGQAMTVDSPIRIASISKLVVTIGVMRLVEAGVLDLERDVSAYLGWPLQNPAYPDQPISLRRLLSHTSSLMDGPGYSFPLGASLRGSLLPEHWDAEHAPGSWFSYANVNFGMVATIMEAMTGERFDRLMQRLVLLPLKLDACFNWSGCSPSAVRQAAALYRKGADEEHWVPDGPWVAQVDDLHGAPPPCLVRRADDAAACDLDSYQPGTNGTLFSPQGGLRISVLGLAKIARLLLNEGEADGARLLKPESVRTMLTPIWRLEADSAAGDTYDGLMRCYGLSVQCLVGQAGAGKGDQPLAGRTVRWFGHLGEAYGLYGGLWIDPGAGRGYVYLVTSTADDPAKSPGRHSAFRAHEEEILARLVDAGR